MKPVAPENPPAPRKPLPRSALRTLLLVLGFNALIAAGWWILQPRSTAVLTDGETIRLPRRGAPVSEILWQPPTPLGAALNTSKNDYEPRFAWDGLTLYFVREKPGENADIYIARRTPAGWTEPQPLSAINSTDDDLGPAPSPDGATLYFYSDRPGGSGGYDLWTAREVDGKWQPATNLGPQVNSPYNDYGPAVTPDHTALLFASNRPRAADAATSQPADAWTATIREDLQRRTYDLYRAELGPAAIARATPLDLLNTPDNEGTPCFSSAGDFLYFASDRGGGAGGFDLYRARWLRDRFLPAVRLSTAINSSANELDPALHSLGYGLVFSSDRELAAGTGDAAGALPDYNLYQTTAREVFRDFDEEPRDWAWLLRALQPFLPWLLLALLALLLLALGARGLRDKRLSLMARCLLASLLLHSLLMFLFSFWQITAGVMKSMRPPGGTQVVLGATLHDELAEQVVALPVSAAQPLTLAEAPAQPLELPDAPPVSLDPPEVALAALDPPTLPHIDVPLPRVPPSESALPDIAVPQPAMASVAAPEATAERSPIQPALPTASLPEVPTDKPPAIDPPAIAPTAALTMPPLRESLPAPSDAPPADVPIAALRVRFEANIDAPALPALAPSATNALQVDVPTTQPIRASADALAQLPNAASPAPALPPALAVAQPPAPTEAAPPMQAALAPATANLALPPLPIDAPSALPTDLGESPSPVALPEFAFAPPQPTAAAIPSVEESASPDALEIKLAPTPIATSDAPAVTTGNPIAFALPPTIDDSAADAPAPASPELAARAEPVRKAVLQRRGGSPETEAAVQAALVWLSKHQSGSGAWNAQRFADQCTCDGGGEAELSVATTGLALLCFLGAGHTHLSDGPYQRNVQRAVAWLQRRQADNGDLRDGETMYSHGIATIALGEACAMTGDPRLKQSAERAVAFIVEARNRRTGGWRYEPGQAGDTSVLGWQVLALKSGQRAGVEIPEVAFRNIRVFLERVADNARPGRYAYRPRQRSTASMTAEAVFVRQLLGDPLEDLRGGLAWIATDEPSWDDQPNTYYWYYATLALFNAQSDDWERWNARLSRTLIDAQDKAGHAAGSWDPDGEWASAGGRVYQTALCTLMLEVYYRYLPMYAGSQHAAQSPGSRPASAPATSDSGAGVESAAGD